MSCEFDQAQAMEQREREAAIRRAQSAMPSGGGTKDCRDCGDEIGAARSAAMPGCSLCVDCQALRERKS